MEQERRLKAVKAEQAKKKKRAMNRKRAAFLFAEVFVLMALLGIGYIFNKYGKFQIHSFDDGDIKVNEGVTQEGYTTIALFGGDSREGELQEGTHADTMMVASIDNKTKEVRIVSVYRDLLTKQEDGKINKANHAYFAGGSKDAINMLNRNFDLAIEDYVTVDFNAVVAIVDLFGGIEADVSEAEANEMNNHIDETARIAGKETRQIKSGKQSLDGVAAVTYTRIRKGVGGDYARTQRQRYIVSKLAEKAKSSDIATINSILNEVFPKVSTSFTLTEMMKLAAGVMQYTLGETKGFAFEHTDGDVDGIGSVVIPLGFKENVGEMHSFLYPKEKYTASETVLKIAAEVEALTGITRDDYKE